ncbi:NAD-dependent epimerase [Paenibacillus swuensis]|nr:NAD-dependent epimerase [Paenibacillus swuensis]
MSKIMFVTGCAGFIGYHLSLRLLKDGHHVIGIDNLNDYYDVNLKKARLNELFPFSDFTFMELSLEDREGLESVLADHPVHTVFHLAAQAGVRYSLENPRAYVDSNIVGFLNILEACRSHGLPHLIYASSSSVYGANEQLPFRVQDHVDHPVSLYAATKKANELMAHSYSHLYGLPTTGLRFFTVYGPWGRPDMAPFLFAKAIVTGETLKVFNHGNMRRDFTYIDDIIESMVRLLAKKPAPNPEDDGTHPGTSKAPYRIYNIGNHQPVRLMDFIETLERKLGKQANKEFLPMQNGDVTDTFADVEELIREIDFQPGTTLEDGIGKFVEWYKSYYTT